MKHSCKMLIVVTLLIVVSVIAPLFAGYCMNCWTDNCSRYDPACIERTYLGKRSYCATCTVNGNYACTDCFWDIFLCEKLVYGQWVQCSPPYVLVLEKERNFMRKWPPYSCIYVPGVGYQCDN